MKIEVNISKKYAFMIIGAILLTAGIFAVYASYNYQGTIPNPGHGADTVWVNTSYGEMTLQQAIDGRAVQGQGLPPPDFNSGWITPTSQTSIIITYNLNLQKNNIFYILEWRDSNGLIYDGYRANWRNDTSMNINTQGVPGSSFRLRIWKYPNIPVSSYTTTQFAMYNLTFNNLPDCSWMNCNAGDTFVDYVDICSGWGWPGPVTDCWTLINQTARGIQLMEGTWCSNPPHLGDTVSATITCMHPF